MIHQIKPPPKGKDGGLEAVDAASNVYTLLRSDMAFKLLLKPASCQLYFPTSTAAQYRALGPLPNVPGSLFGMTPQPSRALGQSAQVMP